MLQPTHYTQVNYRQQLQTWVVIRSFILLCLWLAVAYLSWRSELDSVWKPIPLCLLGLSVFNLLTHARVKQLLPVTAAEFFTQLIIDILVLSLILFGSGGANNPFVSFYLVPISVAAASLPSRFALLIAGVSLVSYGLLLLVYIPLPILAPEHHSLNHQVNIHVLGMWLNFFISTLLITFFIIKMARDLADREAQLQLKREDELRNEQLLAIATLAAGTAHELGTPLATMKLLLGELRAIHTHDQSLQTDLQQLHTQVDICTTSLRNLVNTAEQNKDGVIEPVALRTYCQAVLEHWRLLRPEASFTLEWGEHLPQAQVKYHPSIAQALLNLLNNATNANPQGLRIEINATSEHLHWQIWDNGAGIDPLLHQQLGRGRTVKSDQGMGIGLMLSHASIKRYGGNVCLTNRATVNPDHTGTITRISLPLSPNTPPLNALSPNA